MAFTQKHLDAIEEAMTSGTLTVEYDGKRVTYRSMDELMRVRDEIRRSLAPGKTGVQVVPVWFRRG